jgi:hypothetical protein
MAMRFFRLAAALVLLSVSVAGCGAIDTLRQTWAVAASVVVNKAAIKVAVSAFNAVEATATVYISQPRCPKGIQKPTCMSVPIRETIATAILTGRSSRDQLLGFVEAHPDAIGDQGLYDVLKISISTLQNIFTTYNIGSAN